MVIISLLLIMVKNNTNIPIFSILYTLQMLNIPKNRDYYNATFFTVLPSTTIYTPVRGCTTRNPRMS